MSYVSNYVIILNLSMTHHSWLIDPVLYEIHLDGLAMEFGIHQ